MTLIRLFLFNLKCRFMEWKTKQPSMYIEGY